VRQKNLDRMIRLAEEFFDVKNDPEQIAVDESVMQKLRALDPASMGEKSTKDGPVAWVLVIPTTSALMDEFIGRKISERALLERTKIGNTYNAVYLCSALVLPEYRKKGIAKQLTVAAIRDIQKRHRIKHLFYWSFSDEGTGLAESVAKAVRLPVVQRKS